MHGDTCSHRLEHFLVVHLRWFWPGHEANVLITVALVVGWKLPRARMQPHETFEVDILILFSDTDHALACRLRPKGTPQLVQAFFECRASPVTLVHLLHFMDPLNHGNLLL